MKSKFVRTANTQAFLDAFQTVEDRGASENCFMVVDGAPGYGKTTTAQWFATQHNLPFLRAKREWRPSWMLRELLDTVQITPQHSYERMFRQVIEELGKRASIALADQRPFAIIIDEADHVISHGKLIETLRDISDLIEVPVILVGMRRIREQLGKFPQVASRIEGGAHARFDPLKLDDTRALVEARCSCPVADDLLEVLHQTSEGFAREVLSGISAIQRVGSRLDHPVNLQDMDGHKLLTQRSTGHDVVVRA